MATRTSLKDEELVSDPMGFHEFTCLWPSDHLCSYTLGIQQFWADSVNETDRYYSIQFSTVGEAKLARAEDPLCAGPLQLPFVSTCAAAYVSVSP